MDIFTKRLIMAAMSLFLTAVSLEAVRRRVLRERYALLWLASAMAVLVSALFPSVPDFIARALGISFIEGVSYLFAFFLMMVMFHMSIAISRLRGDLEAQARRLALLKAEIRRLAGAEQNSSGKKNQ